MSVTTLPVPRAWTRREFIATTPLVATAALAASALDGYIDAHAHVWSEDTQRWPRQPLAAGQDPGPAGFPPEVLLEHARHSGVTRVVLIQRGFYGNDNRYMLEMLKQHPGKFSAVARLDHLAADAPEVMRRLVSDGVRGFRISPGGDPKGWLDSAGMDALWRFAAERRLAICPLVDPNAIPSIAKMSARHPNTIVVIDHICRIGARGSFPEPEIEALCDLAAQTQVHVKISAFHALGRKTPPYLDLAPLIQRVVSAFGANRLMWGTDSPFAVANGNTYSAAFTLVHERLEFLTAADRNEILRGTAAKIFFG